MLICAKVLNSIRNGTALLTRLSPHAQVEIDRLTAPTLSSLSRTTNNRQLCPRHIRYVGRNEKLLSTETRKQQDARQYWQDAIDFLVRSKGCDSIREFQAIRSNSQNPPYPFHVKKIVLSKRRILAGNTATKGSI